MRALDFKALAAAILSALLISLLAPDAFVEPRFWAEDGPIFYSQQRSEGIAAIWQPYAGYLHLIPRLIAAFAGIFALEWTAIIFLAGSVFVTSWTSFTIAKAFGGWTGVGMAIAPLLAFGAEEVLGTPTNLQWIAAVGLGALAAAPFERSWGNRAAFIALAALSGPFSVFFAPVYAVRGVIAFRLGHIQDAALCLLLLVCATVQLAFLLQGGEGRTAIDIVGVLTVIVQLSGHAAGGTWAGSLIVCLIVAGCLAGRWKWARLILFFCGMAVIGFTALRFSTDPLVLESGEVGHRYWYVPSGLLFVLVITFLLEKHKILQCGGVAGLILLLCGVNWSELQRWDRAAIDSWSEAVANAENAGSATYRYPPSWQLEIIAPLATR